MATTARTTRAKGATLKAVAKDAEAPKVINFVFDDVTYEVPEKRVSSIKFLEAYEENRWVTAMKFLLGPAQWSEFTEKTDDPDDVIALAEAMFEAADSDSGE